MKDVSSYIGRYYDAQPQREWERLERHRTEFALTLRTLEENLPPPPARLLDVGGGLGRYAIELARRGYQVTLFDLSAANLALAEEKAAAAGVRLEEIRQGDARDLSPFTDGAFDAVLCFGPLYHLLEAQSRRQALAEAARVLAPGGFLFATFISRYAAHRHAALNDPDWLLRQPEVSQTLLRSGQLPQRDEGSQAFVAYLAHPLEIRPACREAGLQVENVLGLEGLGEFECRRGC